MRAPTLVAIALALPLALSLWGGALGAQSASSPTYFLPSNEVSLGGPCASATYRLDASFGSGAVAPESTSATYKLLGGFPGGLGTTTTGQSWVSGVLPPFAPLLGGVNLTVHGHELDLATSVTIGGVAASISSRTKDRMVVALPSQSVPGWQPVTVTSGSNTVTLPRGVGVLPMTEKFPPAIENTQPFSVTYRGRQGDIFYLAVAKVKFPFVFKVPPYHHGLQLNPAALVDVIGPFPVTNPSGEFTLKFPGINFPRPLFVQMLGLPASQTSGYSPGSFTNVIEL